MELFILLLCVKRRTLLPSQLRGKAALLGALSTHPHCVAVRAAKHGPTAQVFQQVILTCWTGLNAAMEGLHAGEVASSPQTGALFLSFVLIIPKS